MINVCRLVSDIETVSKEIKNGRKTLRLRYTKHTIPIIVWNMTYACNLRCKHCYIDAGRKREDELDTKEGKKLLEDLRDVGVEVVLFSGGEPLLREDFFEIAKYAKELGMRTVLSTNGTLIDEGVASKLKKIGIDYVGISLDGLEETNDNFRGIKGAFVMALSGIRNCLKHGINVGIRFTITKYNYKDLDDLIELAIREKVPRFCIYHLVYSGRGVSIKDVDITNEDRRKLMEYLIKKSFELKNRGIDLEILTVDNHADGVYIYNYLRNNNLKESEYVLNLLRNHGGCSAGSKILSISPEGNVYPCQFWSDLKLGNIREESIKDILEKDIVEMLRNKHKYLKGKCGSCKFKEVCGGCRVRAKQVYNDMWQEDPSCYLSMREIS